ncbi:MAG: precorrin-8X methylmutase [Candidatus Brocadiales bacterium]|nr:precorrin-8X methylmutase [Candidatus Bathyanammoxibius amoris]
MKTAVVVVAHGSRAKGANKEFFGVIEGLRAMGRWDEVEPSFLQFNEPGLASAVEGVIKRGAKKVMVVPLLLFPGNHMRKDIPEEIEKQRSKHPGVEIVVTEHLGIDGRTTQMVVERIEGASDNGRAATGTKYTQLKPQEIEQESFRILSELVDLEQFPEDFRPVVQRIIHTTGDPELARTLVFHPDAVSSGIEAVRAGRPILTDVTMVQTGIDKKILSRFGVEVICRISDPEVVREAESAGSTRAAAAMRAAADAVSGGIIAIGNAPTAVMEVVRLVNEGKINPALIVGVPVGFVGAVESKEELETVPVPFITNRGRRGGSTVAVAAVNAILRMAREERP